jgi:hypothetical protein
MDQDWKEVTLALGGIVTGFFLSEGANYFRSYREVTRQGESLDYEVDALKTVLKAQIADLQKYYVNVEHYQNKSPVISIVGKDGLAHIDRHKASKFYARKADKTEAIRIVSLRINRITIIDSELQRFIKYHETYEFNIEDFLKKYSVVRNKFSRAVKEYSIANTQDEYSKIILKILDDNKEIDYDLSLLEDTTHQILAEEDLAHREHALHKSIKAYNEEGLDIIAEMQKQTKDFLLMIFYITRALEFCYKDLYALANNIQG